MKAIASVAIEIIDDCPFAQVQVNNSESLWFSIDSGASACVVDKALSSSLGIPLNGQIEGTGAGAGTVEFSNLIGIKYTLPGVSFTAANSYAIDLSGVHIQGDRNLDGLLGFDFFQRHIVTLDYERSIMILHDPQKYDYRGSGEAQGITFNKHVPYVKGKLWISGQPIAEREWLVDTGSSDALNDECLSESTNVKRRVTGGHGLGKEFDIWLTTADRVEIGKFHFNDVEGATGGMKIGGGLLRNFIVIFDYSRNRMILEPNHRYFSKKV